MANKGKLLMAEVVKRFMSEADFKSFMEEYRNHLMRARNVQKPSDNDFRIAQHVRMSKSYSGTSKALGIPVHRVVGALGRVVAYQEN